MSDRKESNLQGFSKEELKLSKIKLNELSVIIDNPFVCDQVDCKVRFKSLLELEGHKELAHDIYKCEYCDAIFDHIWTYATHFRYCHPKHMKLNSSLSNSEKDSTFNFKKRLIHRFEEKKK